MARKYQNGLMNIVGSFEQHTTRLQSLVDENNCDTAEAPASLPSKKKPIVTTKKGKAAIVEFKDFWGSSITTMDQEDKGPPYVPTLDPFWGSLPKAAYQYESEEIWEPKPTCRIAIDLTTVRDHAVELVQHYLESGFQTFHGASPLFIQKFHDVTPTKLIGKDSIHWVLHYQVPEKVQSMQSVRQDILDDLLSPMSSCTDAIDTLVVQYNPKSPYQMDVLYVLNDLQEEGFIRCIGLENFPENLVAKAVVECGFSASLVQQPGSLLIPPPANDSNNLISHQWTTNPFLDDLLLFGTSDTKDGRNASKRRRSRKTKPTKILASSRRQQKLWDATLRKWAKRHGITGRNEEGKEVYSAVEVSETFEMEVMEVLREMSWRYGVPLKSLVLRWAMELETTSSVVIPAPTGDLWKDMEDFSSSHWRSHIQELRQAFTFRLEEEDKAILAEISRQPETEDGTGTMMMDLDELEEFLVQQGLPEKEIEALLLQQEQQSSSSSTTDYPKIDFDNPKLWL